MGQEHPEEVYHQFLATHASLFFFNGLDHYLTLSKIRLGANHIIDLAVPKEGYSRGLSWNLIELESPHCAPYTRGGDPSKALSHGLQQIRNWRRWITDNREEARRTFPSIGVRTIRDPNFRFTLVIGTRENSKRFLEERNQLADEERVRIRSFNFLADLLRHHVHFNEFRFLDGDCRFPRAVGNWLASPFSMAIPDKDWRIFLGEFRSVGSFWLPKIAEVLVQRRPYNTKMLTEFMRKYGGRV